MTDANYAPPTATVDDRPQAPAGVLRQLLAIFVAFIVDVTGTEALDSALGYLFLQVVGGGVIDQNLLDRYTDQLSSYDNPWGIAQFVIGSGMSVIGGSLCARIAWRREWRAVGWLCVVHVGYSLWRGSGVDFAWWESNAITLGSVLIGAALQRGAVRGMLRRLRRAAEADGT